VLTKNLLLNFKASYYHLNLQKHTAQSAIQTDALTFKWSSTKSSLH